MSDQKDPGGQRRQMIAEAAYFRAERRGFNGGDTVRDWCEAEAEVDARLRQIEDEQLLGRLGDGLVAASRKVGAVKRKISGLSVSARAEWQAELDKFTALGDELKAKLTELQERGQEAGPGLRDQAERLRIEIAELVVQLGGRSKR